MSRGGKRPGAGRPKGEPRVKISLTLKPETVSTITALSEDMGIGKGQVIDRAIDGLIIRKEDLRDGNDQGGVK